MKLDFDIKVDFFKENQKEISDTLYSDPFLHKTLDDITEFMLYMGIEKVSIKGKTKEDDRKHRENLKTRKFLTKKEQQDE